MDKDVERECRTCYGCQLVSIPAKPEPVHRTELHIALWEYLAADFWGPLPSEDLLFVLVHYYSRCKIVEIIKSTTAEKMRAV